MITIEKPLVLDDRCSSKKFHKRSFDIVFKKLAELSDTVIAKRRIRKQYFLRNNLLIGKIVPSYDPDCFELIAVGEFLTREKISGYENEPSCTIHI